MFIFRIKLYMFRTVPLCLIFIFRIKLYMFRTVPLFLMFIFGIKLYMFPDSSSISYVYFWNKTCFGQFLYFSYLFLE